MSAIRRTNQPSGLLVGRGDARDRILQTEVQKNMTTRQQRRSMILVLVGLGLVAQPFFAQNPDHGSAAALVKEAQIENLHPFTHFASIPATADPATIKFERVKATKVFTRVKSTTDSGYCKELQFSDPGGSIYCSYTQNESKAPAYEITYSYRGQPMASDEYGNRDFTFQVYFRPEELPPTLLRALSTGKVNRAELATYFNVATSRLSVRAAVIDEAKSSFCEGNYMDGNWIQNDPHCRDKVSFKTVTMPADNIMVQVDPVSLRPQQAAVATQRAEFPELSVRDNRR
jgi:hypothetical protein